MSGVIDKNVDRNLARQAGAILTDSLFDFAKIVLGYDLIEEAVHYDLCEFMCDRYTEYGEPVKKWKLVLMPRLTFKTTICLEAFAIQQIILNPNIRILIATENFSNSKFYLGKIKRHFENNELLKSLYGDFVNPVGWREDFITVSQRTISSKEPTIMCGGVEKTITGFHYDLIIADDIVTPNNIGTIDQINKVINYYKDFNNLLDRVNPGKVIVIGTRWNFNDLYQHIIDNEYANFNIFIRQAYNPDGTLFFPKILPQKELDRLRLSLGNYLFSCNYLNNPVDKDHAKFKQEWIHYYPADKNPRNKDCPHLSEMNIYTTVDPAISERVEGDFSGIITVGVDSDNNKFVLETKRLKVNPFELINEIFETYKGFKPLAVGIEMAVFQKVLKYWMMQEMQKRNLYLPITELKADNTKSKEYRISGLQPTFEFGSIYLNKSMRELEDELLTFPIMRHDDLIDPLAYQVDMWSPPAKHIDKSIKKGTFAYYMKLAIGKKNKKYLIGHDEYKEKMRQYE